jgi:pimeloyl-ACP methyl ester carboxylesterase
MPAQRTDGEQLAADGTGRPDDERDAAPPQGNPGVPAGCDAAAEGPIARVAATCVATGLLGAAALTLGVFGGAPEHVVTGSALLALALGWALLAVLSSRWTPWPQRWALVPAVAMAVVGAGLLLLAPGDAALTAAGWIWPPLLLALAGWCAVRARRSMPGRARIWVLYPVLAALAVGALGGGYETVRLALDRSAYPAPGRSYVVDGHRLHLQCTGTGTPTVVLEGGLGETSRAWGWIAPTVSRSTRVCAYDRAGQGWSDNARRPQDAFAVADDLHTLLRTAGEVGPYVLVGHSTGGTYALAHAARYPGDVTGMVLVDSASPDQFTALPDYPGFYAMWRRVSALLPTLARLGAAQLVTVATGSTLPEPAAAQAQAFASSPRDARSQHDELSVYPEVFRQAKTLTTLGGRPLVVLTAARGQQAGWSIAQDRLAALSGNGSHRLVDATHGSLLADRQDAAVAGQAVADVVRSVRTGTTLRSR